MVDEIKELRNNLWLERMPRLGVAKRSDRLKNNQINKWKDGFDQDIAYLAAFIWLSSHKLSVFETRNVLWYRCLLNAVKWGICKMSRRCLWIWGDNFGSYNSLV